MESIELHLTCVSDATFGRGDGVAGVVDEEVQHDEYGLPFLSGRTLKGLLAAECAEILYALKLANLPERARWERAGGALFGDKGSGYEAGALHVSDARLPEDLRVRLSAEFARRPEEWGQRRAAMLGALTALRRQTALDATGAARDKTLRTMRVILRGTPFAANLTFGAELDDTARALLAACVKAFRRAGTGRNRGRGLLRAQLKTRDGVDQTETYYAPLRAALQAAQEAQP